MRGSKMRDTPLLPPHSPVLGLLAGIATRTHGLCRMPMVRAGPVASAGPVGRVAPVAPTAPG